MTDRRLKRAALPAALAGCLACALPAVALAAMPAPATAATTPVAAAGPVVAITAKPGLTLEQAVAAVQRKTHGKVLRASSRQYGDATEYRVKVLTPDGYVRVIPVRSRPAHHPSEPESKETH